MRIGSPLMVASFAALTLFAALTPGSAHADIYSFMDAQGIAHFSTVKLDGRYQLFSRGEASFDSDQMMPGSGGKAMSSALMKYLGSHPNLKKYEPLVDQAAREFSIQPALLKAVMAAESGFNPAAVSPKGAIGLMQVMPDTAERYGLQADPKKTLVQKLADPKTNIRLSARYLHDLHKLFPGKPELVIASYNAGEGAVQKYRNTIPPYPETRNYVQLVSQFYRFYLPAGAGAASTAMARSANPHAPKRVHMTIPGRASMPALATTTY